MATIGERIKAARKAHRLTQADLAKLAQVNQGDLSNLDYSSPGARQQVGSTKVPSW